MPRRAFIPTDEQRRQVESLAGYGLKEEDICRFITWPDGKPIGLTTLKKKFKNELIMGAPKLEAMLSETICGLALGRRQVVQIDEGTGATRVLVQEQKPNLGALCFVLKCRFNWSERLAEARAKEIEDAGMPTSTAHEQAKLVRDALRQIEDKTDAGAK